MLYGGTDDHDFENTWFRNATCATLTESVDRLGNLALVTKQERAIV